MIIGVLACLYISGVRLLRLLHRKKQTAMSSCSGEGESEVMFFDSVESMVVEEEEPVEIYEMWMNEPFKSVHERKGEFLRRFLVDDATDMAMERMTSCSGAELINSEPLPVNYNNHVEADETSFTRTDLDAEEQETPRSTSAKPERLSTLSSLSSNEGSEERAKLRKNWINDKKLVIRWWRSLSGKWRSDGSESDLDSLSCYSPKSSKMDKVKVHCNNKKVIELSAVYTGQSFNAHCGMIRTMKFSPDGRYLASGGEDGVVRIWLVTSVDGSSQHSTTGCNFGDDLQQGKTLRRNKSKYASIVIPEKMIHIEESPLHEFHGHSGDVLDLAWSKSDILLSSSMDNTVRMWKVGCAECLNIFQHGSYVTCIQFSPVNDNYFISGSTDGKVRTWKVSRGRVVDWIDVRDVVTAVCYQPDGRGFVAGSISGNCRFYVSSEKRTQLDTEVHISGASNNKITRIEFSAEASRRIMVTLEDSKVHILDVADAADKYRDLLFLNKMSSSLTSRTHQIVSVGEDFQVYVWSHNYNQTPSSTKTALRSSEHFFSDGVSVAIPWLMKPTEEKDLEEQSSLERQNHLDTASWFTDFEKVTGVSRFSMDGAARSKKSATWPAEQLPVGESPNEDFLNSHNRVHYSPRRHSEHNPAQKLVPKGSPASWGLVILTACHDGTIKTYHNFGLPVKL